MTEQQSEGPFVFCTESSLVVFTGRRAANAAELAEQLNEVSGSSIFYHTHYQYLAHHYETPTFYNDFATWTSQALQEEGLAERLAAVDLLMVTSLRELRERLIAVLRRHLRDKAGNSRQCPPGDEFHFAEAKSFVMKTGQVAHSVADFFSTVGGVSTACLHFHFFEARLRLERPTNDFSQWLRDRGEEGLARRIDRLNPYAMTLPELQQEIVRLGVAYQGGRA